MLTVLFIGLGSIGTRHLKNLTAICAQRGLALRADALRSDLARPLRPGAAALLARLDKLNAQFEKAFAKTGVAAVSPYPTTWTYAY